MVYTKEKFKQLWDANDEGSGLTFEDISDCAEAWGLYSKPMIHPMDKVRDAVVKAAGCLDAHEQAIQDSPGAGTQDDIDW